MKRDLVALFDMYKKLIIILLLGLVLPGFKFGSMDIRVHFDDINGLVKNDRVIFEETIVGRVKKVLYRDDGIYTVSIEIEKDFKDAMTEYSRFTITTDPTYDGRMAVEMLQIRMGGTPLKSGSSVEGSDKYSVLLEMMKDDVKDGIEYLNKEYKRFSNELRSLSEHEKVRELKKMIARLGQELKKASEETREKIVTEIIPMIEQEIETLREQLKAYGREKEVEPLEEELKKIKHI